ncbi:MAG: hypothetical protein RQ751_08520, partial [Longimicrobiales bacterium]|nr:hypothetical protein [Longimicrobiales bacterium]
MAARAKRTKRPPKGGRKGSGGSGTSRLLTREQERDILGVCLLVLAAFLMLSLVPVEWFGARGGSWFPSGNLVGVLGGTARGLQWALVG